MWIEYILENIACWQSLCRKWRMRRKKGKKKSRRWLKADGVLMCINGLMWRLCAAGCDQTLAARFDVPCSGQMDEPFKTRTRLQRAPEQIRACCFQNGPKLCVRRAHLRRDVCVEGWVWKVLYMAVLKQESGLALGEPSTLSTAPSRSFVISWGGFKKKKKAPLKTINFHRLQLFGNIFPRDVPKQKWNSFMFFVNPQHWFTWMQQGSLHQPWVVQVLR